MTAFRPSTALTAWLLVGLLPGTSFGQAITGSISGTVEDPSGAAVPSAKVTLIDTDTRVERTTTLNDHGDFVFNLDYAHDQRFERWYTRLMLAVVE